MSRGIRSYLLRYGTAVAASGVALLAKLLLAPVFAPNSFVTGSAAVLFSAWFCGLGPALLVTALFAAGNTYYFLPVDLPSGVSHWVSLVRVGVFVVTSALISWLAATVASSREALERARDELEARVAERTAELSAANALLQEGIAARERAAEVSRQREARLRRFAESDVIGLLITDASGKVLEANDAFLATVGYTREDLLAGRLRWDDMTPPEWRDLNETVIQQLRTSGVCLPVEKEYFRKDGSRVPVLLGLTSLDQSQGTRMGFVLDQTKSKQAAEALRQERNFVSAVLDTVGALVGVVDREGRIVRFNRTCEQVLGYSSAEVMGRYFWDLLPIAGEVEPAKVIFKGVLTGTWPAAYETYWFTRAGERRWLQWSTSLLRDAHGNVEYVVGAGIDITERKRAKERLRISEERFKLAVEGSNDGVWDWNIEADETYFSPRWKRIIGCGEDEIRPHLDEWRERIHPDDRARVRKEFSAHAENRPSHLHSEHRLRHKDGSYRWVLSRAVSLRDATGKPYRMAGSLTDITERKLAEELLRTSEERYALAVAGANDGLWDWDLDRNELYLSPRLKDILGFDAHELAVDAVGWVKRLHPDDQGDYLAKLQTYLQSQNSHFEIECRVQQKDGSYRWVLSRGMAVGNEKGGRPRRVAGSLTDIDERKRAEQALRESEERYRDLVENINDVIFSVDAAGIMTYVSPINERHSGYHPSEVIGRSFADFVHPEDLPALEHSFEKTLAGDLEPLDYRIITKNGEVRWVRSSSRPLIRGGRPVGLTGVMTDITERRRVEEKLKTHGQVFDDMLEGVNVATEDGVIWFTNPAFDAMFGYGRGELVGKPLSVLNDYSPEENARIVGDTIAKLMADGKWVGEFRNRRKDGTLFTCSARISVLEIEGKRHWVSVQEDITERKRADEQLRLSESRFRSLTNTVAAAIFIVQGTKNRYVNPAAELLTGYTQAELCEMEFWGYMHPEFQDLVRTRGLARQRGEPVPAHYEAKILTKGGVERWADITVSMIDFDGTPAVLGTGFDITERKRAEETLKTHSQVLDEMVEGVTVVAEDGIICFTNRAFDAMFGYERGELLGKHVAIANAGPAGENIRIASGIIERLKTHGTWFGEISNRRKNGTLFTSSAHISALEIGGKIHWVSVQEDITERKRAEEQLRQSESRFRSLADNVPAAIFIFQGDVTKYVNPAAESITGYTKPELLQMDRWATIHPDFRDLVRERGLARMRGEPVPSRYEIKILTKSGAERWVDFTGSLVEFDGAPAVLGTAFDITERKQAEEEARQRQAELAHVQRVGTLGELAASLAHELNQPLQAIVNYASGSARRFQSGVPAADAVRESLDEIRSQALRAGKIIGRLRDLVRKETKPREWVDLNELVREATQLMETDARRQGIAMHMDLAAELPRLRLDGVQIVQVLLNLLRNGLEAMGNTVNGQRVLSIHTKRAGDDGAEVAVRDAGGGLPQAIADRAFEPFFTTKPGGLGMGLSISRSIVEAHGGRLWATPNPEGGTTFRFSVSISDTGAFDDA